MPNQTFGSCNQITKGLLAGPVSGIMGLGFEKISSSKTKPFWENLAYQNKLGENQEMGFTFTRFLHYSPSSSSSSGSSGNDGDGGAGGGGDPEDIVMPGGVASFGSANQTLYTGGELY